MSEDFEIVVDWTELMKRCCNDVLRYMRIARKKRWKSWDMS